MSTLEPRPAYTDAELAQLYPAQLQLQLVQILLRHGERTPVTPRFQNTGLPAFWPYCTVARHLRSAVLDPDTSGSSVDPKFSTLAWQRRVETFGRNDAPVVAVGPRSELDSICDLGMLTDRGRETTTALGRRLRHLYVDRLGFLPPAINDDTAASLYLRATPIPRALESLQQTLHGLYPSHTRAADLAPLTILGRNMNDETLFPNEGTCRRFAALARAFADRTAQRWNSSDDMAYLTRKLGRYMDPANPVVAVDGHPRLSGIMDSMNATAAHGPETRLPREFYDPEVKRIIETIGVEEWYSGYRESQEYRALGIGGLLGDIVSRMVASADGVDTNSPSRPGSSGIRFGLSGCHDTTLAGVLASLGAFGNDKWPPFTSHVALELFRHAGKPAPSYPSRSSSASSWLPSFLGGTSSASSSPYTSSVGSNGALAAKRTPDLSDADRARLDGYYVRIRYNDQPVTIPGCKVAGNHLPGDESFCTLTAFKSIVDKFTPTDWKRQCRSNHDAPAFPAKIEPSGF
ncbi:acid phosphatase [Geosmithia morbida]|uniref:3-phytase n=1 Tax=Geosmithia morbida TaxID=1094350 RepID=A0A9P5D0Y3_9HYPO|nr:acid phosphatase [Geosmithia morbida]KAF4123243.1 acid phosphatase [Geosmithia morbida]